MIATASAAKHDYVRELGAEVVIDYTTEDVARAAWEAVPAGVDAVLDLVGGDALDRSAEVLREGARLLSIVTPPDRKALAERGIHGGYVFVRQRGDQLAHLSRLVDDGRVRPPLTATLPLDRAADAHAMLEEGHTRGKIALAVE